MNNGYRTIYDKWLGGLFGFRGGGYVDTVPPVCVISSSNADPTIVSPITFTYTWTKPVIGFTIGDAGIANGTKVAFTTISTQSYTLTVVPNAGATVGATVAAGVCVDSWGNANLAATPYSVVSKVLVWDDFTDTVAAGSVNATAATPGPGTRTVTDTNSKISVGSGVLNFATGAVANDALWYGATTRGYGAVAVFAITPSETTNGIPSAGYDSAASGEILDHVKFAASAALNVEPNGGTNVTVGAYTAAAHYLAAVMRATGIYWFIKGGNFTNFTYLFATAAGTGNGYPAIQAGNTTAVFTSPFARAFKAATYDVPMLAYDTFTQANGALNGVNSDTVGPDGQTVTARAWTSAGGAISTNKLVITPTLGSDLWDAPAAAFTSGTYAWLAQGTNTIANDTNTLKVTYVDNVIGAIEGLLDAGDLSSNLTVGAWYQFQVDAKVDTGDNVRIMAYAMYYPSLTVTETDFTTKTLTFMATSTTGNDVRVNNMGTGEDIWLDNLSLKPLTLSTCLASLTDTATSNVVCSANATITDGFQGGIITNLDSAASPANFLLTYIVFSSGAGYIMMDKYVGGTRTAVLAAQAITYGAGYKLEVHTLTSGTNLLARVYYNGALIGTEQTIADVAGALRNNTIHGLFSTSANNSFTNFELRAKTGYTGLDSYIA